MKFPRSLFVWRLTTSGAKKDVSLGSPLEVVIRLPMADIRSFPTEHKSPMVSNAIGTKLHASASSEYFRHILDTSCWRPLRLPTLVCGLFRWGMMEGRCRRLLLFLIFITIVCCAFGSLPLWKVAWLFYGRDSCGREGSVDVIVYHLVSSHFLFRRVAWEALQAGVINRFATWARMLLAEWQA